MFSDPAFWVGLAFVLTVAGISKPIWLNLSQSLDNRASKIKGQIDEARELREDAQVLLAEHQKKQKDSLAEAKEIIKQAKQQTNSMKAQAESKLRESLERIESQAFERIKQTELQAIINIRNEAANLTIVAVRNLINEHINEDIHAKLIDNSISELKSSIN